jgi:hypothetical protein
MSDTLATPPTTTPAAVAAVAPEADNVTLECDEEMPIWYDAECQGGVEFEQVILQDQAKLEDKKRERQRERQPQRARQRQRARARQRQRQYDKQKTTSKSKPTKKQTTAEQPLRSSSGRILKPSLRVTSLRNRSPSPTPTPMPTPTNNRQDNDDTASLSSHDNNMEAPTPVTANKRRRPPSPSPPQESNNNNNNNHDDVDSCHEDTEDDRDLVAASASLRYNWDSLQLGTKLGSAAYNTYIQKQQQQQQQNTHNSSSRPPYTSYTNITSHETLRLVQSFRPPTILPPPGSSLFGVVQHSRLENHYLEAMEDEDDESYADADAEETGVAAAAAAAAGPGPGPPRYPFYSLARLYQTMLSQDTVDADHEQYRRHVQYLSPQACVQEIQDLSKRAEQMKQQEQRVLQTGRDLGLYTEQTTRDISRLLGYTKQQEREQQQHQEADANYQHHD